MSNLTTQSMADEFKSYRELELDDAERKIVAEAVDRGARRPVPVGRKTPRELPRQHLLSAENWLRYLKRLSALHKAMMSGEIDLQFVANSAFESNPDDMLFLKRPASLDSPRRKAVKS